MAAASTDKLKKVSKRWVGQIGAGGVADASVTTIPLASTTNLPTDTGVVVTIDRVDVNGTLTPTLEESVIGVVSGSNLISCVRGAEGTAQSHSAGAVVEVLLTAKGWNDIIDAFLVAFNQDGSIKSGTSARFTKRVLSLSANSATPAINTDNYDVVHITNQTAAITSFTSGLTGSPVDGDTLRISITGTGAVALTWGTSFGSSTVTLPTTTVSTNRLDVGFFWSTETSKWLCVASA